MSKAPARHVNAAARIYATVLYHPSKKMYLDDILSRERAEIEIRG